MTQHTNTASGAAYLPAIQRYKIGYQTHEWGERSSTPSGIRDDDGSWVRYTDHIAVLIAQAVRAEPAPPSSICTDCSHADVWNIPDKPCCRTCTCTSGSNWGPLNRGSVNPNKAPIAQANSTEPAGAGYAAPDEREAFEAMMRKETFDNLKRLSDGDYVSYEARVGWIAWKARASHGQASAGTTVPHLEAVIKGAADKLDAAVRCHPNAIDALIHEALEILDGDREPYCTPSPQPAQQAPTAPQPAPPADSVLEDAARLDWLDQQCGGAYGFEDMHEGNRWEIMGAYANVRQAIDAERAACKQGGQKP